MTIDEVLASLFPSGHRVVREGGLLSGHGPRLKAGQVAVVGVEGQHPIGVDEAIWLSRRVLDVVGQDDATPILVLIDSDSQRMSKRDELLGLNEFLAHLAKCLIYADAKGHPTVSLLYGNTAAGAFIASALSTRTLVALPGAQPMVMDLPSMSRVTKLSIEVLQRMAQSTPVFAPGLDNLVKMGGVSTVWDPARSLAEQLEAELEAVAAGSAQPLKDRRDRLGKARGGRPKAADIADRVYALASKSR